MLGVKRVKGYIFYFMGYNAYRLNSTRVILVIVIKV